MNATSALRPAHLRRPGTPGSPVSLKEVLAGGTFELKGTYRPNYGRTLQLTQPLTVKPNDSLFGLTVQLRGLSENPRFEASKLSEEVSLKKLEDGSYHGGTGGRSQSLSLKLSPTADGKVDFRLWVAPNDELKGVVQLPAPPRNQWETVAHANAGRFSATFLRYSEDPARLFVRIKGPGMEGRGEEPIALEPSRRSDWDLEGRFTDKNKRQGDVDLRFWHGVYTLTYTYDDAQFNPVKVSAPLKLDPAFVSDLQIYGQERHTERARQAQWYRDRYG